MTQDSRPTFRERMQEQSRVRQQVEECTAPADWRFLNARFGSCSLCRTDFEAAEVVLWHVRTGETMHPQGAAAKYPHLAKWVEDATRWRRGSSSTSIR